MKIHLIRESSFDRDRFDNIINFIGRFPGPVKFVTHEEPVTYKDDQLIDEIWNNERLSRKKIIFSEMLSYDSSIISVSWKNIFEHCRAIREEHQIPAEEAVVLLTNHANEFNWFMGADDERRNLFIQTSMWDLFIKSDLLYPVAHQIATIPLALLMFDSFRERVAYAHRQPRGCINDLCEEKQEVALKLRTADICPDCRNLIEQRNIDPLITAQVFSIMEETRKNFINYTSLTERSAACNLKVDYRERLILLPTLGLELPLGPMEKAVYHFFLNHPEGISYAALPGDYKQELLRLYEHYSDTDSIATLENRINKICKDRDVMSNLVSRINKNIRSVIPESIQSHYIITSNHGMKQRVLLPREKVLISSTE